MLLHLSTQGVHPGVKVEVYHTVFIARKTTLTLLTMKSTKAQTLGALETRVCK